MAWIHCIQTAWQKKRIILDSNLTVISSACLTNLEIKVMVDELLNFLFTCTCQQIS